NTWTPLAAYPAGSTTGFLNYGACYARGPNDSTGQPIGNDACGKAHQYLAFCKAISCETCPASQVATCASGSAASQQCTAAGFDASIANACGTDPVKLQDLDAACGDPKSAAAVLCGGQ